MKSKLLICDLVLQISIGWTEEERSTPQQLMLSAELELDTSPAAESGSLEDTVCYGTVVEQYQSLAAAKEWHLVEELAEELSSFTLQTYPPITGVRIQLRKFVVPNTGWVGIEIERSRTN